MGVVTVTSGIRGGVGKSLIATVLSFTLNYLGKTSLIIDAGGGSTRYVFPSGVPPPYTRDLPRTFDAIVQATFSVRAVRRRLFGRGEELRRKVPVYITPEVGELSDSEIDAVVEVLPSLRDYFDYIIVDLPAVSNRHYWRFLEATDVQVVCLVPEAVPASQILETVELKASRGFVVVLNKYDGGLAEHREVAESVRKYVSGKTSLFKLVTVPFDPAFAVMGSYGLDALLKLNVSRESAKSIADIIVALEDACGGV